MRKGPKLDANEARGTKIGYKMMLEISTLSTVYFHVSGVGI